MSLVHFKETPNPGGTVDPYPVPVVEVDGREVVYTGPDDAESVGRFIDDSRAMIRAGILEDLAQAIWEESGHDENRARRMVQTLALVALGHLEAVEAD